MSTCILRQFIITSRYRVSLLPAVLTVNQRGAGIKCTCPHTQCYRYGSNQQSRHFSTSNIQWRGNKISASFDEYYSAVIEAHKSDDKLVAFKYQEMSDDKTERDIELRRWMFVEAVDIYIQKSDSVHHSGLRRGHIDFITEALSRMKDLGVHRDLACYKALIKVVLCTMFLICKM